jgi:hypothetical protein
VARIGANGIFLSLPLEFSDLSLSLSLSPFLNHGLKNKKNKLMYQN